MRVQTIDTEEWITRVVSDFLSSCFLTTLLRMQQRVSLTTGKDLHLPICKDLEHPCPCGRSFDDPNWVTHQIGIRLVRSTDLRLLISHENSTRCSTILRSNSNSSVVYCVFFQSEFFRRVLRRNLFAGCVGIFPPGSLTNFGGGPLYLADTNSKRCVFWPNGQTCRY